MKMKKLCYAAVATLAAAFVLSCAKEETPVQPTPAEAGEGLVPMTFTASVSLDDADADTKTVLDGLDIHWAEGDKIAIYDNVDSYATAHEFQAVSDGGTTTFTGTVNDGATEFFAVYPYSAAEGYTVPEDGETYVGKLNVNFPTEQTPVAGSFDPDAAVLVAHATSESLNFMVAFSLVKFKVDYDDVISVSLSSSNRSVAGSVLAALNASSVSTSNGSGTVSKTVTLKNSDNTPLARGSVYYIALRNSSTNTPYQGFTATIGNSSYSYATKTASGVALARKKVHNLGTFSGLTFKTNLYQAYQDGLDVTIAGKTYNKSVYGDAVELSSISTSALSNGVVHFLKAGTEYTLSSSCSISSEVVLAGEDPDDRATINMSKQFCTASGSFALANVNINASGITTSSNTIMLNTGATTHFDRLALSNCAITDEGAAANLWYPHSSKKEYAIKEVYFDGNLIRTSGTLVSLINPTKSHTGFNALEKFTFTNNVMYSSTGSNVKMQLANFTGSTPTSGWTTALKVDNNIFYNTTTSSGLFRSYDIGSVDISNNIFYAADDTDPGGNAKVIALNVSDGSSFSANTTCGNNYAYGSLTSGDASKSWVICDSKFRVGNLANPAVLSESPIATADVSTGTFALTSDYSGYGPQPIPAP